MSKDYYEILGVKKDASQDDIKAAYKRAALKYHPDRQHGKTESEKKDAEEMFKKCSEAYETISDPEKRKRYDMFGPEGANQQGGGFGANFDPREFFRRHMQGFGFGGAFGGFDDFPGFGFGCDMGGERNDPNSPEDGRTIRLRTALPMEDMLYGTKKTFDVSVEDTCEYCHGSGSEDGKRTPCPQCGGSGMMTQRHGMMIMQSTCPSCRGSGYTITKPCHVCHGSGNAPSQRHFEVEIPKGMNDGGSVIIRGKGLKGRNGGRDGDVLISVSQEKHDIFERDGMDLLTHVTISSVLASLGGDIEVYTPWGKKKVEIAMGTNTGKTLKLEGYGVRKGESKGDLYVVFEVETMSNPTEEQKRLLNTLKDLENRKNYPKMKKSMERLEEFERNVSKRR